MNLFATSTAHVTQADVQAYRLCDALTGALIYVMVVFSPWAFGTTQPWSIWTMNVLGYALGILLFVKLWIRLFKGYSPLSWRQPPGAESAGQRFSMVCLGILTLLLLAFCLVSALNARSSYVPDQLSFEYRRYLKWLPHSLDSSRTWLWFWNYLALAFSFWAAHDWLLGKAESELRRPAGADIDNAGRLPARLKSLLWLLAINGALLGIEGIIQRVENSGHLLFLVKPRVNPGAESQFGPFAYRANASSYFNLVWPTTLGLWYSLQNFRSLRKMRHVLLLCAAIMAACPVISTSRGGAIITAALVLVSVAIVLGAAFLSSLFAGKRSRETSPRTGSAGAGHSPYPGRYGLTLLLLLIFSGITFGLAYQFGWKVLKPRLTAGAMLEGFNVRAEMYERARPMARDYPLYGTGPGSFATVFQMYRFSTDTYWPAQLHNDWLETRITFGWVGMGLALLALAGVATRPLLPGGIRSPLPLILLVALALAGCLAHARYDFPFQIYSLVHLFLTLCAALTTFSACGHHRLKSPS